MTLNGHFSRPAQTDPYQKKKFRWEVKVNHISCLRPIIEVPRECRQPETSGNDISITNDSSTLFEVFEDSLPTPNIVNIFNNLNPVCIVNNVNIVNNINVVKNINWFGLVWYAWENWWTDCCLRPAWWAHWHSCLFSKNSLQPNVVCLVMSDPLQSGDLVPERQMGVSHKQAGEPAAEYLCRCN